MIFLSLAFSPVSDRRSSPLGLFAPPQYCGFCHLTFVFANAGADAAKAADEAPPKGAVAAETKAPAAAAAAKPAKGKK